MCGGARRRRISGKWLAGSCLSLGAACIFPIVDLDGLDLVIWAHHFFYPLIIQWQVVSALDCPAHGAYIAPVPGSSAEGRPYLR